MAIRTGTRRLTGTGAAAALALAVLVLGCVLAATAAPREASATSTRALHQATAAVLGGPAITVSADISIMAARGERYASVADLNSLDGQLNSDFNKGVLHLEPASADWTSITGAFHTTTTSLSGTQGDAVEVELSYVLPLARYAHAIAGSLAAPAPGPTGRQDFYPTINVAVTRQTADQFGLKVGSTMSVALGGTGGTSAVALKVAAIVTRGDPGSSFWGANSPLAAPGFNQPPGQLPFWDTGVFVLPDEYNALLSDSGFSNLAVLWDLPLNINATLGYQAQQLDTELARMVIEPPPMTSAFSSIDGQLLVSENLKQTLGAFTDDADNINALLSLLYASLGLAAVVVLLLAGRMITDRRAAELALLRSRGASLLQITLIAGRGAAVTCVPAAVLAGALAVLLVPGQTPPGGWWLGLAVVLVAVGLPAVLAAWQHRLPRGGVRARRSRSGVRLVVEAAAVLAAVAGIVVLQRQASQPGTGTDLFTSAVPALTAVPFAVVAARLYPLVLRAALRGAARRRGAVGFLGLARAARSAFTPTLPAFALVLAITVASFAGMVQDAVTRGEVSASWQTTGADVAVSGVNQPGGIPAAAQHALTSVPGVQHAAIVAEWTAVTPYGDQVSVFGVNPASYAALVASGQTWPAVDPALLSGDGVIASPQALAYFGGDKTKTLSLRQEQTAPIQARVAGILSATPALPGGGAFVLMSDSLSAHEPGVVPNLVLLNGTAIDTAKVTALAKNAGPLVTTAVRSAVLAQLTGSVEQTGTFLLFALALIAAAGLGLTVLLLQLALGAADRETTMARLSTMGLAEGQRARLVLLETLPAILTAAIAAVACALTLPKIIGSAVNLSVFTRSTATVPLVPDAASIVLPVAGLAVVAALTLTIEIRTRRGAVATLIADE